MQRIVPYGLRLQFEMKKTLEKLLSRSLRCLATKFWMSLDGQAKPGLAPSSVRAVPQSELSTVSFGDLPAENETNAGTARFGGEERHEQVGGIGKPRTIVDNPQFHLAAFARPSNLHATFGFQRGIGRVAN